MPDQTSRVRSDYDYEHEHEHNTGRLFDEATGLQNNLSRWYNLELGCWLTEDPIGFEGGDGNLYRYCGNDPVNWVDPSGLSPWEGIGRILGKRWSRETCERAARTLATELLDTLKKHHPNSQKAQEIIRALKKMGWVEETLGRGSRAGKPLEEGGGLILCEMIDGKPTDTFLEWHPGGGHHGPDAYWKFSNGKSGILRTVEETVGAGVVCLVPGAAEAMAGDYNAGARQLVYEVSPIGWGAWVTGYFTWLFDWAQADLEQARKEKIKF